MVSVAEPDNGISSPLQVENEDNDEHDDDAMNGAIGGPGGLLHRMPGS